MTTVYLVQNGAIAGGPYAVSGPDVRRITSCGNPEQLSADYLRGLGLVPEVRDTLAAGQEYGAPVLQPGGASVRLPALNRNPQALAAERAAAIRAERDRRILSAGYRVGSHWFHSDLVSRGQQTGLVIMGVNIPAGLTWKTMGGASVPMTQQLAGQIFQAAATSDATLHAVADAAIAAGVEPSAVQWPPAFGD